MGVPLKVIVSKNVRVMRKSRGFSQQELAKRTKLSVRYINRVENDPPDVTLYNLEKLAVGLGVTVAELVIDWGKKVANPSRKGIDAVTFTIRLLQSYLDNEVAVDHSKKTKSNLNAESGS